MADADSADLAESQDIAAAADPRAALTPRQEAFCQKYAEEGVGSIAAQTAGYESRSCRNRASILLAKPKIRARIAEIRVGLADRLGIDKADFMARLETLYLNARYVGQYGTALRVVELQAYIAGVHPVERRPPARARSHLGGQGDKG